MRNLKGSVSGSCHPATSFFLDTSSNLVVLVRIISALLIPPIPNPSHFSLSALSASVCSPLGRESVAAAPRHQMGHCQEVMRENTCFTSKLHSFIFSHLTQHMQEAHTKPSDRDQNSSGRWHISVLVSKVPVWI